MNKQKFTKMVRTYITLTHKWWKRAILQYIRRLKVRKNTITVCCCIKSLNKFMLTINNNWKSSVKVINLVLIYHQSFKLKTNKFCSIFPLILRALTNWVVSGSWRGWAFAVVVALIGGCAITLSWFCWWSWLSLSSFRIFQSNVFLDKFQVLKTTNRNLPRKRMLTSQFQEQIIGHSSAVTSPIMLWKVEPSAATRNKILVQRCLVVSQHYDIIGPTPNTPPPILPSREKVLPSRRKILDLVAPSFAFKRYFEVNY